MSLLDLAWAGLAPDRVERLIDQHGGTNAVVSDLGLDEADPKTLEASGVRFVTRSEPAFPARLAELPDAPRWLFVRGEMPAVDGVAVVGSRRATRYGLELARLIGSRLAASGRVVVSGMAAGIDGAAHRGCLDAGGTTVAVLGSGIDVWYPARHRSLGEEILESGGAVVSEFPPGTRPEPWRFPARNRIISGLSRVVVVVEAAERSGALITARLAVGHGRDVFAVPGDIDRSTSRGCNLLIRDGAHPVTDVDALVEMVEFVMGPSPVPTPSTSGPVEVFGVTIDAPVLLSDLVEATGRSASETLAELGRLEAENRILLEAGMVSPAAAPCSP